MIKSTIDIIERLIALYNEGAITESELLMQIIVTAGKCQEEMSNMRELTRDVIECKES